MGWVRLMQSDTGTAWYVARVKPGETDRALKSLSRSFIQFINPVANVLGKEIALLNGYLFLLLTDSDFGVVKNLAGLDRLLPIGSEEPKAIPAREINEFFQRLNKGDFDVIAVEPADKPLPRFTKNEILGINSGPFAGHTGTFVRVHKGIVELQVKCFGATTKVFLNGHQVQQMM